MSGARPSIIYSILDIQLRKLRDALCIRVLYVVLAHRMIGLIHTVPFFVIRGYIPGSLVSWIGKSGSQVGKQTHR